MKGKIGRKDAPSKVYLTRSFSSTTDVLDSAVLKNGAFSFKGQLKQPGFVFVVSGDKPSDFIQSRGRKASGPGPAPAGAEVKQPDYKSFYLAPGVTELNTAETLTKAVVTGASERVNADAAEMDKMLEPVWEENGAIGQLSNSVSEEERKTKAFEEKYNAKIEEANRHQLKVMTKFVKGHPASIISLVAMSTYMTSEKSVARQRELFNSLTPDVRGSDLGVKYSAYLDNMQKTAIGSAAPDFKQQDVNGKTVGLSDYKGKYVLIDFWASWCVPCRKENPNVLKAYEQFKGRNFTILGVSLDNSKDAWIKAVVEDKLPWTQVSDLKAFNNEAAVEYSVTAIPTNFLVDPQGNIVASNLRGVELEKKLLELLGGNEKETSQVNMPDSAADQKELYEALKSVMAREQLAQDTMIDSYSKDPVAANKKYDDDLRSVWPERQRIMAQFIQTHPDSYVSLHAIEPYITNGVDISVVGPLYDGLSERMRTSSKGVEIGELLSRMKKVAIGMPAPVFSQQTPDGKTVSLADLKGKYVLIDFWASWCLPCRGENPSVVKAYEAFSKKGFTVLGVSLDGPKTVQAWKDAIKKDGLNWTQVSDLKEWENAAAHTYAVRAIPANFLVDPNGVIVARSLHGEELMQTLSKLLK